jgi:outer membrane protein assembly factor BamB
MRILFASVSAALLAGVLCLAMTAGTAPKEEAASADWPQWRGPNRDAVSSETGLMQSWPTGGPPLAWQASGLGFGFSSLAIVGEKIFTMGDLGNDQFVIALKRANGELVWKARVGSAWHDEYGGPRSTPTVDGDLLYAIGTDGDLVCLETATGKERWRKNFSRDYGGAMMSMWKYAESPLVDGAKVVFTPGGEKAAIVAVDKKSGRELWRSAMPDIGSKGRDGAGYSSIVVSQGAGVRQYVQLMGRGLVSVRSSDGKFLWGYNRVANHVANIPTPIVRGDYVFATSGYDSGGSALLKLSRDGDGVKEEEVYFHPPNRFQNHHGGLVLVGEYLYGGHGHNRGLPICVEFATGRIVWGGDIRNNGRGSAAVAYADGHLYFRYQSGLVMLIEATPSGYKEKGEFEIPNVRNPSWSHPVILDGKLYLREQDMLYVYDLRPRALIQQRKATVASIPHQPITRVAPPIV